MTQRPGTYTFALMSTKGSVILSEPSLYRGQVQSLSVVERVSSSLVPLWRLSNIFILVSQVRLVRLDLSAVKKELSFWRFRCCSKCWREWSGEGESILNASLLHSSIPNIAILPNAGRRESRARGNQKRNQKGIKQAKVTKAKKTNE